jgi:hypothetical protein
MDCTIAPAPLLPDVSTPEKLLTAQPISAIDEEKVIVIAPLVGLVDIPLKTNIFV